MMKKSSLGRKSFATVTSRKTSDFTDRKTGIPVLSRSSSASVLSIPPSTSRKRDLSGDRISMNRPRDAAFDRMFEYSTPCHPDILRTPRQMTMSSGRASSISSKKGDTRPLTDKEWQSSALDTVRTALNMDKDGYNVIETHKSLKPMSLAMFVDICNYLLGRLDSKIQLTRVNYLTELPFLMKKLMYKGKIDKMMLQTVNTPHNWPNVLGILHFLAELFIAAEDFKARGLDSIYPESIEAEIVDEEELNLKHVVPLFSDLWGYVDKQEDFDINELLERNKDLVNHAIHMSGFSNDVFDQEAEINKAYEDARKKNKEALEMFHKVEVQNKTMNDKINKNYEKSNDLKKEIDEGQIRYQEELKNIMELENELKYIEEERGVVQNIVDQYGRSHEDSMTPDEYDNYNTKKQTLLEDIRFATAFNFNLEEILFDETGVTAKLKKECESLFREYNNKIYELMKDDVSLRNAQCLTRPRMGVTPCNEATAQFLEKTLNSYNERIAGMNGKLKETCVDSTENFKLSEDTKDKMALLNKLKSIHSDMISDHEKLKFDLQKTLVKLSKDNDKTNEEIELTEALLKENLQEHLEKEIILKQNEEKLRQLYTINEKKLNCRQRAILMLSQKLESNINIVKDEFVSFYKKLEDLTEREKN